MTETFKGSPGELENLIDKKKREVVRRDAAVLADAGIAGEGGALAAARNVHATVVDEHGDLPCSGCAAIAAALTEARNEGIEEAARLCDVDDEWPTTKAAAIRALKRTP